MSNLVGTTVMCPECGAWNVPGHSCRDKNPFQDIANALAREVRETDALRSRLDKMETFLSSAVMVGGRLTVERDRYRKALEQIIRTCTTVHTGSAFAIADEALDYDLPQEDA